MKLAEALNIVKAQSALPAENAFRLYLVCGFMPLHLKSFLVGSLSKRLPNRRIVVEEGLYGDLLGNLDRAAQAGAGSVCLMVEWADLDARLSIRSSGNWSPLDLADVVQGARSRLELIGQAAARISADRLLAVCLPNLPLPPVSYTSRWKMGSWEAQLREAVSGLSAKLTGLAGVHLLNPDCLDAISPPGDRLDVQTEIHFGFPYRLAHAAVLADLLAKLVVASPPKKGLITDLDDTLWQGILGEVGEEGVTWDLDHQSRIHGLYQLLLQSLAESGVLLGVASKNELTLVQRAIDRDDLILKKECLFPVEAHWGPKSESVARILRAWHIQADSVVFVDDDPAEIDEVKLAHPGLEGLIFPKQEQAVYELIGRLRDLFGRDRLSDEDALRRESLQRDHAFQTAAQESAVDPERFLGQAEAEITVSLVREPLDPRALELVNKTNQFNLNGRRYTEADWRTKVARPGAVLLVISYRDKYGSLGKIMVLQGTRQAGRIQVQDWVMSCRAFSRRIEYHALKLLFEKFDARELILDFMPTDKNHVMQLFLKPFSADARAAPLRVTREQFSAHCPPLYHRIREVPGG